MRKPLRCRNHHEWDPVRDFAAGQITGAACPTCGEPPLLEGTEFWEASFARGCFVVAGGFTLLMVLAGASMFLLGPQWRNPISYLFALITVGLMLLFGRIHPNWGMPRRLKVVATGLNLTYSPALPPDRRELLARLPLVDNNPASNCLAGSYRGTPMLLMDVTRKVPGQQGRCGETVVVFPDPVSDLPDFTLEPIGMGTLRIGEPGHFWNKDLLRLVGLRRPGTFQDDRFAQRYCLQDGSIEELGDRLTHGFRDLLARHPGWGIQARQGMLLFYREFQVYPPEGRPTLLALAWQLREMLRKAGAASVAVAET